MHDLRHRPFGPKREMFCQAWDKTTSIWYGSSNWRIASANILAVNQTGLATPCFQDDFTG